MCIVISGQCIGKYGVVRIVSCLKFDYNMLVMRKLLLSLILLFGLFFLGVFMRDVVSAQANKVLAVSVCEYPKTYRIGRVDPQFQLSKEDFRSAAEEAADIWSSVYGKQLFVYDPDSDFTVNLLFDERQSLNTEINEKNADLKEKDSALRPRIEAYNRKSVDLQARIKKLNDEIASWNAQGGAPDPVYDRLREEQVKLREEMAALNAEAEELELSTDELRDEAESLEQVVTSFNDALHDRPEGGKYTLDKKGERIDVAIFDTRDELVNVLAHEFGHSLGMDHVTDTKAIMYAKANEAASPTEADIRQLRYACRKRNLLKERWDYFREHFVSRLGSFISIEHSR